MSSVDAATTREQRVHELRREGLARVLWHLREGRCNAAREWLYVSVEQQARIAGINAVLPRRDI